MDDFEGGQGDYFLLAMGVLLSILLFEIYMRDAVLGSAVQRGKLQRYAKWSRK